MVDADAFKAASEIIWRIENDFKPADVNMQVMVFRELILPASWGNGESSFSGRFACVLRT